MKNAGAPSAVKPAGNPSARAEGGRGWPPAGLGVAVIFLLVLAVAHHAEAVRLKPPQAKYQFNLGIALAKPCRFAEAVTHYTTALRLQPGYADVHNNLTNALARQQLDALAAQPPP